MVRAVLRSVAVVALCASSLVVVAGAGVAHADIPSSSPAPVVHRFPQTRDAFEQGRQADPAFGGVDVRRAIDGYRRAVGLDVENAQYRNYLGGALLGAGDATGAIHAFAEAARLAPREAKYVVNLGYAWHRRGDELRALVWFQRAIAVDADDIRAHLFAGYALQNLGLAAEAITEFQTAARLDPDDAAARAALQRLGVAQPPAHAEPADAPPLLGNPPPTP